MAKYSDKTDVYSFAIVMWEVLTRKVPYEDRNMMTVALDVINGNRPPIPSDCPENFAKIMQKCWMGKSADRPTMDEVVQYLNSEMESLDV